MNKSSIKAEINKINKPDKANLKINPKFTIHHLVKFYDENIQFLNVDHLNIDASNVSQIDTAGLQLIAYYVLRAKENNNTISWEPPPSTYFQEQSKLAGMTTLLTNKVKQT